jgi:hypothetical protein
MLETSLFSEIIRGIKHSVDFIVPTLRVGMPPSTHPRHLTGILRNTAAFGNATRSVWDCIPTRSVGTMKMWLFQRDKVR